MRALTICQPYAWLFTLPAEDPRQKRVENRTWATYYRGPVLIHAGKSDEYLATEPTVTECEIEQMPMGAIVARGWLVACLKLDQIHKGAYDGGPLSWVREHRHTHGPYCHIIGHIETLETPIFCAGKQSYWLPYDEVVQQVVAQLGPQRKPKAPSLSKR